MGSVRDSATAKITQTVVIDTTLIIIDDRLLVG